MENVFVTGATRGIGRSIAIAFAKKGYRVGFSYHKSHALAESLCREIGEYSEAYSFCCDFSSLDEVAHLAQNILNEMGPIDVLINNAGVASYGLFQDVKKEEFDRVLSVNFSSMFVLTQGLVSAMIQKKEGSIINLSSVWGQVGASCEVLYSAAKAAVIGFSKALAKELAPSGIRVNCIAPGIVDTDMMAKFSKEEKEEMTQEIPAGRFASPDEVASLALFLASDGAEYITGQVLSVNGGMY